MRRRQVGLARRSARPGPPRAAVARRESGSAGSRPERAAARAPTARARAGARSSIARDHPGEHLAQHGFDVAVVVDEAHLDVERHVLGEVADGVVRLGAEHRPGLVHPLEHPDHDLLVQLRALSEVRAPAEVVEPEHVGAALRRGTDDLRRLDLGEAEPVERRAKAGERRRGDRERGADAGMAKRHRGVIEQGRQRRVELRPAHLERRRPPPRRRAR